MSSPGTPRSRCNNSSASWNSGNHDKRLLCKHSSPNRPRWNRAARRIRIRFRRHRLKPCLLLSLLSARRWGLLESSFLLSVSSQQVATLQMGRPRWARCTLCAVCGRSVFRHPHPPAQRPWSPRQRTQDAVAAAFFAGMCSPSVLNYPLFPLLPEQYPAPTSH